MSKVVARNVRGPFPAGQCFQMNTSHRAILEDFHCYNDIDISYTGDSISAYRSNNVIIRDGVVDGNNSPTGMCVMFEGSKAGVRGGLIENVEAVNCQGCFSGYPATRLRQRNVTCASPVCPSDKPFRGGKTSVNLWTAGNNNV